VRGPEGSVSADAAVDAGSAGHQPPGLLLLFPQ
jgi:hypothetical protein